MYRRRSRNTVNDVIAQAMCRQLHVGGISASGMGHYHCMVGITEF